MNTTAQHTRPVLSPRAFLTRLLLFFGGWIILVGGQLSDLWFVALVLLSTTAISLYCIPPAQWNLRPVAVAAFVPYFLLTAIRGGWDVARRAFYPTVPIDPDFLTVTVDDDHRRTLLLTWIISLLPGTAGCEIHDDRTLTVHVLDKRLPVAAEIKELQRRIARMTPPREGEETA